MTIGDAIAQLGARLDQWFDGNLVTFASEDRAAQAKALLRGFEIVKELDRLKAEGLAALSALVERQDTTTDDEHAAALIRGFKFGARLADALHDELLDTDGQTKVVSLMVAIANALDAIGRGRAALAVLPDHRDAGVRAAAGAYLIKMLPERVIPILREIEENEDGNGAHFSAAWTLLRWELDAKSPDKG